MTLTGVFGAAATALAALLGAFVTAAHEPAAPLLIAIGVASLLFFAALACTLSAKPVSFSSAVMSHVFLFADAAAMTRRPCFALRSQIFNAALTVIGWLSSDQHDCLRAGCASGLAPCRQQSYVLSPYWWLPTFFERGIRRHDWLRRWRGQRRRTCRRGSRRWLVGRWVSGLVIHLSASMFAPTAKHSSSADAKASYASSQLPISTPGPTPFSVTKITPKGCESSSRSASLYRGMQRQHR